MTDTCNCGSNGCYKEKNHKKCDDKNLSKDFIIKFTKLYDEIKTRTDKLETDIKNMKKNMDFNEKHIQSKTNDLCDYLNYKFGDRVRDFDISDYVINDCIDSLIFFPYDAKKYLMNDKKVLDFCIYDKKTNNAKWVKLTNKFFNKCGFLFVGIYKYLNTIVVLTYCDTLVSDQTINLNYIQDNTHIKCKRTGSCYKLCIHHINQCDYKSGDTIVVEDEEKSGNDKIVWINNHSLSGYPSEYIGMMQDGRIYFENMDDEFISYDLKTLSDKNIKCHIMKKISHFK